MTARNAARPRVHEGQKPRISTLAMWTLACFTLASLCLLWSVVVLLDVLISRSP